MPPIEDFEQKTDDPIGGPTESVLCGYTGNSFCRAGKTREFPPLPWTSPNIGCCSYRSWYVPLILFCFSSSSPQKSRTALRVRSTRKKMKLKKKNKPHTLLGMVRQRDGAPWAVFSSFYVSFSRSASLGFTTTSAAARGRDKQRYGQSSKEKRATLDAKVNLLGFPPSVTGWGPDSVEVTPRCSARRWVKCGRALRSIQVGLILDDDNRGYFRA